MVSMTRVCEDFAEYKGVHSEKGRFTIDILKERHQRPVYVWYCCTTTTTATTTYYVEVVILDKFSK